MGLNESRTHRLLKKFAVMKLKQNGFYHIEEEYPVLIDGKAYRVDVAGLKGLLGKRIAIECGFPNNPQKLSDLKKLFNEVKVYTLDDVAEFCEEYVDHYTTLQKTVEHAFDRIKDDFDFFERGMQGELGRKSAMFHIRCNPQTVEKFKELRKRLEAPSHEALLCFLLWVASNYELHLLKERFKQIYRRKFPFELK